MLLYFPEGHQVVFMTLSNSTNLGIMPRRTHLATQLHLTICLQSHQDQGRLSTDYATISH